MSALVPHSAHRAAAIVARAPRICRVRRNRAGECLRPAPPPGRPRDCCGAPRGPARAAPHAATSAPATGPVSRPIQRRPPRVFLRSRLRTPDRQRLFRRPGDPCAVTFGARCHNCVTCRVRRMAAARAQAARHGFPPRAGHFAALVFQGITARPPAAGTDYAEREAGLAVKPDPHLRPPFSPSAGQRPSRCEILLGALYEKDLTCVGDCLSPWGRRSGHGQPDEQQ